MTDDPRSDEELRASVLNDEWTERIAAALILADRGVADRDALLVSALAWFDYSSIPGSAYDLFHDVIWHIRDALADGRRLDVTDQLLRALDASAPNVPEWIDVRQDVIATIGELPPPDAAPFVPRLVEAVLNESEVVIAPYALDVLEDVDHAAWRQALAAYLARPDAAHDLVRYSVERSKLTD